MTYFTHHSRCPKCAEIGKDKDGNNLANYSDGSTYCFSCQFFNSSKYLRSNNTKNKTPTRLIRFPTDGSYQTTRSDVQDYWTKYNLTEEYRKQNLIIWSPSYERVCFPIFDDTGLIAWQGRSFNPDKSKWYSQGDLKSILHILGPKQTSTIILTEDIISSIIVSLLPLTSCPLFGSHLSLNKLQKLKLLNYNRFILWLDKDKEKESLKYSYKVRQLGYDCISLVTDKDPKDYDPETIKKYLTERTKCATLN